MSLGIVLVELQGGLELGLGLGGSLQIQEHDAESHVVRGVLGIELDGLLDGGHAEGDALLAEVAQALLIG